MDYFGFLGSDPQQALDKVGPILDDLLRAHEKQDYELFACHLAREIRKKVPEQQFLQAARDTHKRLGRCEKRRFLAALRRDDRPMLLWSARFSGSKNDILISMILEQQDDTVAVHWFWLE